MALRWSTSARARLRPGWPYATARIATHAGERFSRPRRDHEQLAARLQNLSTPTVDPSGSPWTGEDSLVVEKLRRSEPMREKNERHRHVANHR